MNSSADNHDLPSTPTISTHRLEKALLIMNMPTIRLRSAMIVIGSMTAFSMMGCSGDRSLPANVPKSSSQRWPIHGEAKPAGIHAADEFSQDFVEIDVANLAWRDVRERIRREVVARAGVVCIWDIPTKKLKMIGGRNSQANPLSVSGCKSRLAVIGFDVSLFDMPGGKLAGAYRPPRDYSVNAEIGVSSACGRVAYATDDQRIHCIDVLTGRPFWSVPHSIKIAAGNYRFLFSPNELYLALEGTPDRNDFSSSARDVVYLWDLQSGDSIQKVEGKFLTFSPDGKSIVVSAGKYPSRTSIRTIGSEETRFVFEDGDVNDPRFGWFTDDGLLVIDSSGNRRSVELDLTLINYVNAKVIRHAKLDALPYGDMWAVSSDGKAFARVMRNGTNEARIVVNDVDAGTVRLNLDFTGSDPANRGEVIGGVSFVGTNLLATTHPYVLWTD
jgi:hypothetical protein